LLDNGSQIIHGAPSLGDCNSNDFGQRRLATTEQAGEVALAGKAQKADSATFGCWVMVWVDPKGF
jgi:hypothetical protein